MTNSKKVIGISKSVAFILYVLKALSDTGLHETSMQIIIWSNYTTYMK
jgi:hypothetical protein